MTHEELKDLRDFLRRAKRNCESGRSMVEVLGVLAIIGVLSVMGIAGYSAAMKKHKSNELLNEVSKLSVHVSSQAMLGKTELSVAGFGTDFDVVKVGVNGFAITTPAIDKSTCKDVLNSIGDKSSLRYMATKAMPEAEITECGDDGTAYAFVYNNDLSAVDFVFEPDEPGEDPNKGYYSCESGYVRYYDPQATESNSWYTTCDCSDGATSAMLAALCASDAAYCSADKKLYICTGGECVKTSIYCPCPGYETEELSSHICRIDSPSYYCGQGGEDCYLCHSGVIWMCGSDTCRDFEETCDCEGVWGYYGIYYRLCDQKASNEGYLCVDNRVYELARMEGGTSCLCTTNAVGSDPSDVCRYEGPRWVCRDGLHVDRYENGILEAGEGCTYTCQTGESLGPGDNPWCWR